MCAQLLEKGDSVISRLRYCKMCGILSALATQTKPAIKREFICA